MDAFAFEFMGLMMVALCLVVLALPSGRRPSKHVRYEYPFRARGWPGHRLQARAKKRVLPPRRPQKAVLCLKPRAKICPKTLDIPALSAERLS